MFRNYFKVAFRSINRNKAFSFINIIGLAVGMAVCIMILLWVQDELTFDRFHENYDRIHRILVSIGSDENQMNVAVTPAALAPNLAPEVPEIEEICRFKNWGAFQIKFGEGDYVNIDSGVADNSIFKIFTIPLVAGDSETALLDPSSLVLSTKAAEEIFGDENPLGQIVEVKDRGNFTITGLMVPSDHSHFGFGLLAPFEVIKQDGENIDDLGAGSFNFTTYVLLNKGVSAEQFDAKIRNFYIDKGSEDGPYLYSQALKDIYLHSDAAYDFILKGNIKTIYIFSIIAALVLLIACINFMNLSTAKSGTRAREIGIRKVSGSSRLRIIIQFFCESILYALLALLIALILVEILLPQFNHISGKAISLNLLAAPQIFLYLIGISILTGLISGIYPALMLSSFKPITVLKGSNQGRKQSSLFRTILVIFQFSLSIILMVSALTVRKQLSFMNEKELGYNKHQLVFVNQTPTIKQRYNVVKENLLQLPEVTNITATNVLPLYECPGFEMEEWEGKQGDTNVQIHRITVEPDFLKTFEIELVEGRFFSSAIVSDTNVVVLNEEAVRKMGMENPVGKHITSENIEIIGVIKDFNYNNVRNPIEPLLLINSLPESRHIFARINTENSTETLDKMKEVLQKIDPDVMGGFNFFDTRLERLYRPEQNAEKLITYFTILAIFVSSLGLFGLAGYITERRTKEIGIRKVLGSSVKGITFLLTKEFCKWVTISILIAWPISWLVMNKWLQGFAYKVEIGILNLVITGLLSMLIAVVTVGFHTVKAAGSNPIEALKYE